jgi:hypothetical protein
MGMYSCDLIYAAAGIASYCVVEGMVLLSANKYGVSMVPHQLGPYQDIVRLDTKSLVHH